MARENRRANEAAAQFFVETESLKASGPAAAEIAEAEKLRFKSEYARESNSGYLDAIYMIATSVLLLTRPAHTVGAGGGVAALSLPLLFKEARTLSNSLDFRLGTKHSQQTTASEYSEGGEGGEGEGGGEGGVTVRATDVASAFGVPPALQDGNAQRTKNRFREAAEAWIAEAASAGRLLSLSLFRHMHIVDEGFCA
ncbi:MAG: hypothetical protein GY911_04995 [Actinomycetales bacterium]|nr:hypothetical protein [Actinomycetales bacterium]